MKDNTKKENTKRKSIQDFFANATGNNTQDRDDDDTYYGMKHTINASNVTRL